jgi:hypothetical protein
VTADREDADADAAPTSMSTHTVNITSAWWRSDLRRISPSFAD